MRTAPGGADDGGDVGGSSRNRKKRAETAVPVIREAVAEMEASWAEQLGQERSAKDSPSRSTA